jgi:hypothetical protein
MRIPCRIDLLVRVHQRRATEFIEDEHHNGDRVADFHGGDFERLGLPNRGLRQEQDRKQQIPQCGERDDLPDGA